MAETLELIVEIAVTEDGSAQAMIFPDPDGYTASSLLLETGKSGQMIWVHRIKVTVPLPYVTEAAVAVAPHASGVLGVEPFDRWGDTARKGDHRPTLPTPERAAPGSSEGGK